MSASTFGTTSFRKSLTILFCVMVVFSNALPQSRSDRQALAVDPLATGLTNTGISFNPSYEGQDSTDSYFGYQSQQQQMRTPYGYDDPSVNNVGIGRYDGNQYGYGKGAASGYGYGNGDASSYGLGNRYGRGYGKGRPIWRGFGASRNPQGISPNTQYGIKY